MTKRSAVFLIAVLACSFVAPLVAQGTAPRPQVAAGASVTISAEIVAFDAATREVTLKGPLGGLVEGVLSDEVKDLTKFKVGDMVSASYFEAIAASVQRKGDARPLFSATDAAAKVAPGQATRAATKATESVSVVSIDLATNTLVLKGANGTLYPTTVERPEFRAKLKDLRVGDQIDISYSEALITGLTPVKPGEEARISMKVGTLVIDSGEIVKRNQNLLLIRNDRGRIVKVVVEGDFRFNLDGKEVTVYDLKEGTKLTRVALRVKEVSLSD